MDVTAHFPPLPLTRIDEAVEEFIVDLFYYLGPRIHDVKIVIIIIYSKIWEYDCGQFSNTNTIMRLHGLSMIMYIPWATLPGQNVQEGIHDHCSGHSVDQGKLIRCQLRLGSGEGDYVHIK